MFLCFFVKAFKKVFKTIYKQKKNPYIRALFTRWRRRRDITLCLFISQQFWISLYIKQGIIIINSIPFKFSVQRFSKCFQINIIYSFTPFIWIVSCSLNLNVKTSDLIIEHSINFIKLKLVNFYSLKIGCWRYIILTSKIFG